MEHSSTTTAPFVPAAIQISVSVASERFDLSLDSESTVKKCSQSVATRTSTRPPCAAGDLPRSGNSEERHRPLGCPARSVRLSRGGERWVCRLPVQVIDDFLVVEQLRYGEHRRALDASFDGVATQGHCGIFREDDRHRAAVAFHVDEQARPEARVHCEWFRMEG